MRFWTSDQLIELAAIPASSTTVGFPLPRTSMCSSRPPISTMRPGGGCRATMALFERLSTFHSAWHRRGPHGIFAGEFDRAPAHHGSAAAPRSGRPVLEDVFDRDSAGRDSLPADLLLESDHEFSLDLSGRPARREDGDHASAGADPH